MFLSNHRHACNPSEIDIVEPHRPQYITWQSLMRYRFTACLRSFLSATLFLIRFEQTFCPCPEITSCSGACVVFVYLHEKFPCSVFFDEVIDVSCTWTRCTDVVFAFACLYSVMCVWTKCTDWRGFCLYVSVLTWCLAWTSFADVLFA